MDVASPWWLLGAALLAEIIGTMAGFGAATLLTPVAMLLIDPKQAIAVVACFHLFGNLMRLVYFGPHIHWRTWWQFGLTGIACSAAGALLTGVVSSALLQMIFGLFLLIYVGCSLRFAAQLRLPATAATLFGSGALSGFIAGLLGTGGAVRSAALLVFGYPRDVYLGTSAALALLVDGTRVPLYAAEGLLTRELLKMLPGLAVVAVVGASLGQWLVRRLPARVFHGFVLALLVLMAIKLLWEGAHGLFA